MQSPLWLQVFVLQLYSTSRFPRSPIEVRSEEFLKLTIVWTIHLCAHVLFTYSRVQFHPDRSTLNSKSIVLQIYQFYFRFKLALFTHFCVCSYLCASTRIKDSLQILRYNSVYRDDAWTLFSYFPWNKEIKLSFTTKGSNLNRKPWIQGTELIPDSKTSRHTWRILNTPLLQRVSFFVTAWTRCMHIFSESKLKSNNHRWDKGCSKVLMAVHVFGSSQKYFCTTIKKLCLPLLSGQIRPTSRSQVAKIHTQLKISRIVQNTIINEM